MVGQLEAAVYLLLKGFGPIPIHTLIWASRGVLHGLHRKSPIHILEKMEEEVTRRVKPEFAKQWHFYQNRAANFFKHADRDPDDFLDGVDIHRANQIELLVCILATQQYLGGLPEKLACGLLYVGHQSEKWFDFKGYCQELPNGAEHYEDFRRWTPKKQREIALGAFERIHLDQNWKGLRVPSS